jgi:hypothetical protein
MAENGRVGDLRYRTTENALVELPAGNGVPSSDDDLPELAAIVADLIGREMGERRRDVADLKHALHELELKVAECSGAVSVLRRGGAMRVCGTYSEGTRYEQHDVVMLNGSSFVAIRDDPGQCPGEAWRLLARAGSRGARGLSGPKGERGEPGEPAPAESGFKSLHLDRTTYTVLLSTTDGRIHELNLRGLFEQFLSDMRGGR